MKSSKVLAALVTLGLAAAVATPAMALENQFSGLFAARYINSNFNRTATTDYNAAGGGQYDPTETTKNQPSSNFVEQRLRLGYTAKANADLKLVTAFELDYSYWGDASYGVHRNSGAAVGADEINIETKSIYLDANILKNINMKLGMMPNNDAFKGVLFDTDMAGILLSSSYGKFSPSVGFYRFNDGSSSIDKALGKKSRDMFMLDGKFEVTKNLKVGGAYYFFGDNQQVADTVEANPNFDNTDITGYTASGEAIYGFNNNPFITTPNPNNDVKIHALGLNAEYVQGPLTLNGFALYETGWNNKLYTSAFAGNVGAKLKVGPGIAHSEFMYVTGGVNSNGRSNALYSVDGEHGYYDNDMVILGRDKNAYTTDNSILYNAGNGGQGQIGGYVGYELPINDKLTTACNAGFAAVAKDTGNTHKSNYLGTEINAEATYKLIENLTAGVRVGYVILGDYYDGVALNGETPVNPYDAKLMFKYTF